MVQVRKYQLPPTNLIPNSRYPLLYYPGLLGEDPEAIAAMDALSDNGWQVQWIYRYGSTQKSHYHSAVHECMAVLSGSATIRFGVADDESNDGTVNRVEIQARAGDAFVLPAGLAHKTFDASPVDEFKLLTPGDGHETSDEKMRNALADIKLSGFTMIGAYPKDGNTWDFAVGGEHVGSYEKVWSVTKPEKDPFLGTADEGLRGQWE